MKKLINNNNFKQSLKLLFENLSKRFIKKEELDDIENQIKNNLNDKFLDKTTFLSIENKDSIKKADLANKLESEISSDPGTIYMHSSLTNEVGFYPLVNLGDIVPDEPIYPNLTKNVSYLIELSGQETAIAVTLSEKNNLTSNYNGILEKYTNEKNLYGNKKDLIIDKDGCKIKNKYTLTSSLNNDNIQEINLFDFLNVTKCEVVR